MKQGSLERAIKVNCTTTLFFARLGNVRKDELKCYCEQFGPVKDISVMVDQDTQKPKGCGFVKFMTHEDAKRCVEEAPKKNKGDPIKKNWVIEWAKSSQIKEGDLDKTTLYISNLNKETNVEDMLRAKFGMYGVIEKITRIENAKGSFAFVKYDKMESAVEAINKENGKWWCGNLIVVEFSETIESKRSRRQKATMKKQFSTHQINQSHTLPEAKAYDDKSEASTHRATKSYTQSLSSQQLDGLFHIQDGFFTSQSPSPKSTAISSHKHTTSQPFDKHINSISPFDMLSPRDNDDSESLPIFRELVTPSNGKKTTF
ncbi:RNA-binding protein, putative [Entamoeba invadens IP1]|uniref:RNA-binding protein, putative n=1 Tax=Entamoeba invadens IP1 TaxID=370355 RepID=A0A0A1UEA1_ENTIV|nr:RNA-binding protein, putative [Entamoeba invadens IP1]ELP92111.1 RNA-binding protein, putative [Entamoeba invadens IP1]|eukprot:XP_004258882.1 RNA-binding protein, putative [Entamoeba invadens IP1]